MLTDANVRYILLRVTIDDYYLNHMQPDSTPAQTGMCMINHVYECRNQGALRTLPPTFFEMGVGVQGASVQSIMYFKSVYNLECFFTKKFILCK